MTSSYSDHLCLQHPRLTRLGLSGYRVVGMGVRRKFSREGGTTNTLKSRHVLGAPYKKSTIFGGPKEQKKKFTILRPFKLNYMVFIASAKDASKNLFRVLCRMAAYDLIFKFQDRVACAAPAGAYGSRTLINTNHRR